MNKEKRLMLITSNQGGSHVEYDRGERNPVRPIKKSCLICKITDRRKLFENEFGDVLCDKHFVSLDKDSNLVVAGGLEDGR